MIEFFLVSIGVIVIFISYKSFEGYDKESTPYGGIDFENEYGLSMESSEEKLKVKGYKILIETEEKLAEISKIKTGIFNDSTEEILEKITNNHEEVIFLYNLLNDKEKELKKMMVEINEVKMKPSLVEKLEKSPDKISKKKTKADKNFKDISYEKIIDLHNSGKSILEISKELNIGQGEVRLIVDLHGR